MATTLLAFTIQWPAVRIHSLVKSVPPQNEKSINPFMPRRATIQGYWCGAVSFPLMMRGVVGGLDIPHSAKIMNI